MTSRGILQGWPLVPGQMSGAAAIVAPAPIIYAVAGNRGGQSTSKSTAQVVQSRITNRNGSVRIRNPRIRYATWYMSATGVITPLDNDVTVKAALEIGGTIYPMTAGGSRNITIGKDADYADTDPLVGVTIDANTTFYARQRADGGSGGFYPYGIPCNSSIGDGYENGTAAAVTDKVDSGTINSTGFYSTFGPYMVWGEADDGTIVYVLSGDSLTWGGVGNNNEGGSTGGSAQGGRGHTGRMLTAAGRNYVNVARPSVAAQNVVGAGALAKQLSALAPILPTSRVIVAFGRNDITQSRTAAQIEGDLSTLLNLYKTAGAKAAGLSTVLVAISGAGTASDASDQTVLGTEPVRVTLNNRVTAKAVSGQEWVYDAATPLDLPGSPGKARPGYLSDGTHETTTGAANIAAALTPPG